MLLFTLLNYLPAYKETVRKCIVLYCFFYFAFFDILFALGQMLVGTV